MIFSILIQDPCGVLQYYGDFFKSNFETSEMDFPKK
jgi:hypothetical protein